MLHCGGCICWKPRESTCPGVTCPQCAQHAVLIGELWGNLNAKDSEIATLTAERDALQRHYDAAGPEHNLLALLDRYDEQRRQAQAERDALRAVGREMAEWIYDGDVRGDPEYGEGIVRKWRSLEGNTPAPDINSPVDSGA